MASRNEKCWVPSVSLLSATLNKPIHTITESDLIAAAMTPSEGIAFRRAIEALTGDEKARVEMLLSVPFWEDGEQVGVKRIPATHHIDSAREYLAKARERFAARHARQQQDAGRRVDGLLAGLRAREDRGHSGKSASPRPDGTRGAVPVKEGLTRLSQQDAAKHKARLAAAKSTNGDSSESVLVHETA